MNRFDASLALALIAGVTYIAGCNLPGQNSSSPSSTTPNDNTNTDNGNNNDNGGSGGTFTAADLVKSPWTSDCVQGSEPFSGAGSFIVLLSLNTGGEFNYVQSWYAGSSCSTASNPINYSGSGTYSVGGVASGSLQSIQFTLQPPFQVGTSSTSVATAMNNTCGEGSPYCDYNVGSETCSVQDATTGDWYNAPTGAICEGLTFPTNSGSGALVENVASYSSGTLKMGAFSLGILGVFSGNTVPTTTSVTFH